MAFKPVLLLLLVASLPSIASAQGSGGDYKHGGGYADCQFGILATARHGTWFTGEKKICYCNDGQWQDCRDKPGTQAYVPPPSVSYSATPSYSPCYEGSATIQHGSDFQLYDGRTCTCNDGQWTYCSKPYVPPPSPSYPATPSYSPCYEGSTTIQHGSDFQLYDGRTCTCNDGQWTYCSKPYVPPQSVSYSATQPGNKKCYWGGQSASHGQQLDKGKQRCTCQNGKLVKCYDLCQAGKAELMFLFDTSQSLTEDSESSSDADVGEENWSSMQRFTGNAIRQLPIGPYKVKVSLSRFSDSPSTLLKFSDPRSGNKNAILSTLWGWDPKLGGNTYLGRAMDHAWNQYSQDYKFAKVLVILTDGNADDESRMRRVAQNMRNEGFIIWAVGVGNIEYDQLLTLTGTGNRILQVDSFEALTKNLEFLTNAVCRNYNV